MEIVGIGTDIVEIERFNKDIDSFVKKYFSLDEIEYFKTRNNNIQTISGNFAAKEAVVKALGTGFRQIDVKDVEILREESGKPFVRLNKEEYKNLKFMVSISHSKDNAVACALCYRED